MNKTNHNPEQIYKNNAKKLDQLIDELNQTMNFILTIDNYRIFSLFELTNQCQLIPSLTISIYLQNTINDIKIKINHFTYYEYGTPIVNYSLTDFHRHEILAFLNREEVAAKYCIRYVPAICELERIKEKDQLWIKYKSD